MFKDCGSYLLSLAPQGSDSWHQLRRGRITASRVLDIIRDPSNRFVDIKPTAAMIRGSELEPVARAWYQTQTGYQVEQVGLAIPKWDQRLGASPDGLIGDQGMIEIKCPLRLYDLIKVYNYYQSKGLPEPNPVCPDHYAQIQMNLAILDRSWCDYVVYVDPEPFVYRVDRDLSYWDRLYSKILAVCPIIDE